MNMLNSTKLLTLELLILYYVNFTSTTTKWIFHHFLTFNIAVAFITCTHHYSVEEEVNG